MDQLLPDYFRLTSTPEAEDKFEAFNIVLDSAMYMTKSIEEGLIASRRPQSEFEKDARTLFQMTMTKGIAVRNLISGIYYENPINERFSIRSLIDPMSLGVLIRSQFEAYCLFHNIYLCEDNDVQDFLYRTWVISGLKTRQSYVEEGMQEEHREKAEHENRQIEAHTQAIQNSKIFERFDEKKTAWVWERIRKKAYEFDVTDSDINTPGWRKLFLNTGARDIFQHEYSFLSLCSHPSNVSVFQFDQMFGDGSNFDMAVSLMNRSKEVMAMMIADYCSYLPEAKAAFHKLPKFNQILIDSLNSICRVEHNHHNEHQEEFYGAVENFLRKRSQAGTAR